MAMFEDDQTTNEDAVSSEDTAAEQPEFDASTVQEEVNQDVAVDETSTEETQPEETTFMSADSEDDTPAEADSEVAEEQADDAELEAVSDESEEVEVSSELAESDVEVVSEPDSQISAEVEEEAPVEEAPVDEAEGTLEEDVESPEESDDAAVEEEAPMVTEASSLIEEASSMPVETLDESLIESAEEIAAQPQAEVVPFADELASISEAESEIAGELAAEFAEETAKIPSIDGDSSQEPEAEEELVGDAVAVPADEDEEGRHWYVVHCYSGYENKVRHNLEQRIESMGMKDLIFDVVVPTEEEIEVKDGKRRSVERRVFPGYILVNMALTEESWYVVRNTPGVTSFVGMGNDPIPLRPEEVSQIIKRMEADAPRIKVTFKQGERVRIVDGPFNDFRGTVSEIDMEKAKVRVMVNFFGRDTPVELDFLQVEKA